MNANQLIAKIRSSKDTLMNKFDFENVQFYMFLPTFDSIYRKELCKRIAEYGGAVTLTPKAGNQYVIVSDNLISMFLEQENQENYAQNTEIRENTTPNILKSKRMQKLMTDKRGDFNESGYQKFMLKGTNSKKNQKHDVLADFESILKEDASVLKITDLHHIMDYYDSFTKFDWHWKKDDCRLLRSLVNGEGCFIITSRKKVYMKMRHRMEYHKFSSEKNMRKFDIPKLCMNAPKGTSLIQTSSELQHSLENKERIEGRYAAMILKLSDKFLSKSLTPWANDQICWKIAIEEPKPKKDSYYCWIWNDDYVSYISHIATNQHKLSSYADNLAQYYDQIDTINLQLGSDLIEKFAKVCSPLKEDYNEAEDLRSEFRTPQKEDDYNVERLSHMNQLIDNILYKGKKTKGRMSIDFNSKHL